jgi:hypothetical protein
VRKTKWAKNTVGARKTSRKAPITKFSQSPKTATTKPLKEGCEAWAAYLAPR